MKQDILNQWESMSFSKLRSFPVNVAKFLRIPILKNFCERLLLKISTPVAIYQREVSPDFITVLKSFSILNFVNGFVM